MASVDTKICRLCNLEKTLDSFYIENIRDCQFIRTECKECIKDIKKTYRKKIKFSIDGICRQMLRGAKKRSVKRKTEKPNFDAEYLKEIYPKDNKCPILKIDLIPSENYSSDNSPTLDRIDPKKPYEKNNIVIVSNRANRLKSNASYEELKLIFEYYDNIRKQDEKNTDN